MVVLDPKGEIVRAVGGLLESRGYEVRVLDLVRMERSHCYNPLSYIESDADAQRLNTNLFKATTPKGAQSQDPFWDTAAGMLHLALLLYLVHEAPPEAQLRHPHGGCCAPARCARTTTITPRCSTSCSTGWR